MRGPPPFVRFCSKTVCEIRSMVDDTQGGTSARHASFETLSLIGSGKFGKVSACADKRCLPVWRVAPFPDSICAMAGVSGSKPQ